MVSSQTTPNISASSSSSSQPTSLSTADTGLGTLAKKILTGVTGLGMVAFVVFHMLGNLTLLAGLPTYNQLAKRIDSFGPLLWLIEGTLTLLVVIHASIGINIYLRKRRARNIDYQQYESAGAPSRQTLSSRTMIFSGVLLGAFLVSHLATFKFGPTYFIPGTRDRDLSRLVIEVFQQPGYTAAYVAVLSALGLHLRHGLWSALQSLGISTGQRAFIAANVGAIALTLGFIAIPLSIYFHFIP